MSNKRKDLYFELKEATVKGISVDPVLWERVQKEAEENGWDKPPKKELLKFEKGKRTPPFDDLEKTED